jgi:hypothetical protein
MKSIEELCQEIESPRFSAELNVASDLRTFERGVQAQPERVELADRMQDATVRSQISERALALINAPRTTDEEPAEDTAVSVYLLLLAAHDELLSEQVATALPRNQPWWWARKIADRTLSSSARSAGTVSTGKLT